MLAPQKDMVARCFKSRRQACDFSGNMQNSGNQKKKVSKNHSRDSHKKEEKIGETKCEHTDQI